MNLFAACLFRGVAVTSALALAHGGVLVAAAQATVGALPVASAADPVAVFAGEGLELVVETSGADGRELRGHLHHRGQHYPFTASTWADWTRSEGRFRAGNDTYSFVLLPAGGGDRLTLVTGDADTRSEVTYDLRRRGEAAGGKVSAAVEQDGRPAVPPVVQGERSAVVPVGLSLLGPVEGGWRVTGVAAGSRAELAGFAPGDLIAVARDQAGADLPLADRAAVVAALKRPGAYLTVVRPGRADHTVVLYPVGAPAAALARIEVAPVVPPAETARDTPRTDPVPARGSPAAALAPVETSEPTPAAKATAAFTLRPASVSDPRVTGLISHRVLLPPGWSLDAEVLWTPAVDAALVNLRARATGPEGHHEVTWLPDGAFTDTADAGTRYGAVARGRVYFPYPDGPSKFIREAVLPRFRPQARDVQVRGAEASGGEARGWRKHHVAFLEALAEGAPGALVRVTAPRVRLRYEEDGVRYDEVFSFIWVERSVPVEGATKRDWFVFAARALRAPADGLVSATPRLRAVAESLRSTEPWRAVVQALAPRLARSEPRLTVAQTHEAALALLKRLAPLVAAHAEGWSASEAARTDRLLAFAAEDPGLRVVQATDGTQPHLLPAGLGGRVLVNAQGWVLLTRDAPATDVARPGGPWRVLNEAAPR